MVTKEVSKAKKKSGTVSKTKGSDGKSPKEKILYALLQRYKFGTDMTINDEKLSKLCDTHIRTHSYVDAKKALIQEGSIEKVDGGFVLTEKGAEEAGFVKEDLSKFRTDEEYHKYLKSTFTAKWKGVKIFDLLKEHGALSRQDLCGKIGVKSGTHSFSYGLKELKDYGYVGLVTGSKRMLELTSKTSLRKEGL